MRTIPMAATLLAAALPAVAQPAAAQPAAAQPAAAQPAASLALAPSGAAGGPTRTQPAMLPDRVLQCVVARLVNIDPAKPQTLAEIRREGAHRLTLHLPPAPVPQGPAPDPADEPGPVDPAVRLTGDEAGIFAGMRQPFDRVIDRWPERVELAGQIGAGPWNRFIAVTEIDSVAGTASLFTSRVQDAASLDLDSVYQGNCRIVLAGSGERG